MPVNSTPYFSKFKRVFKILSCQQSTWILSIALSLGCLNELSSQQTMTSQAPVDLVAAPFTDSPIGLSDLVVVEGQPANTIVNLYKNQGSGTFSLMQQIFSAGTPNFAHVAVGNLGLSAPGVDRDIALQLNSSLFILRNDPPGIFSVSPQGAIPTPAAANSVTTGHFQFDMQTRSDVVVACNGNNTPSLAIYLNNGMGDFPTTPIIVPLSSSPSDVATGDVDGDGIDEIVVTYFNTNQVEIFKKNGLTEFISIGQYAVGQNPNAVAVGALQGTNTKKQDIAVTSFTNNTVSVLLNNTSSPTPGTFQAAVNYPVQNTPASLVLVDLNNDGINHIAVANQASSTVSLLINNGNGSFNPALNQNANSGPVSITAGKFYTSDATAFGVANFTGGYFSVFNPSTAP